MVQLHAYPLVSGMGNLNIEYLDYVLMMEYYVEALSTGICSCKGGSRKWGQKVHAQNMCQHFSYV